MRFVLRQRQALCVTSLVLAAAILGAARGCTRHETGGMHTSFEGQVVDLGRLLVSEIGGQRELIARFSIPNASRDPLALKLLDTNCGCQRLELPNGSTAPGSTAHVVMWIKPYARVQRHAYQARVLLDSGRARQRVTLRAELDVLADLVTEPAELTHNFQSGGAPTEAMTVKMRVRDVVPSSPEAPKTELPSEITVSTPEYLGSRLLENPRPERTVAGVPSGPTTGPLWEMVWRMPIGFQMSERVKQGFETYARVVAHTGASIDVPVRLRQSGPIEVTPRTIVLTDAGSDRPRMARVLLRAADGTAFEVQHVDANASGVSARAISSGMRALHIVEVSVPEANDVQGCEVRVATSHSACPEVAFVVQCALPANRNLH